MGAAPAGAGADSGSDPLEPHRCNARLMGADFLQPQVNISQMLEHISGFCFKEHRAASCRWNTGTLLSQ